MTNERLRQLCIENNWFTCGDNCQYDKLFTANQYGAPIEELVTIIWLCSDSNVWKEDIEKVLRNEGVASKCESTCTDDRVDALKAELEFRIKLNKRIPQIYATALQEIYKQFVLDDSLNVDIKAKMEWVENLSYVKEDPMFAGHQLALMELNAGIFQMIRDIVIKTS